jgi:N-methylhydantoinase A
MDEVMKQPERPVRVPVRIGIDVGGTFTKGVAIGASSRALLAQERCPTTHEAQEGVVAGILEVLQRLVAKLPEGCEVTLVAHATTQATNALLEGDTAKVGILALGPAGEEFTIRKLTRLSNISLSPSRRLEPAWAFVPTDTGNRIEGVVKAQLQRWLAEGTEVVAVNQAFGVDDPRLERQVITWAADLGLSATAGSDLSGVYGLELRCSTSAVNASILPTMLRTATYVERALEQVLPGVPLLVVRGDGGAVDIQGLRETPIQTVVSGPAASLAGAILTDGVSDGIFFEVGGTSTNIGAIKGGRPVMKHMTIMDFPTSLRAADIRIAGVAGGSLLRLKGRRIEQVGPRSAHIAGLPYACFAPPEALEGARLITVAPRPGDSADYAVLETLTGSRYALTPTCAANALDRLPEGDSARASPQSARLALSLLAAALGASLERTAEAVLEASAEGLVRTVAELAKNYDLKASKLYGGGGGANVLGPTVARRLGLPFVRMPQAEIISSIGAALTLIRFERDRSVKINDPTIAELLTREVESEAVRLGADPARLQTEVHYLPAERLLRAVAVGAHPVDSHIDRLNDDVLRSLARGVIGSTAESVYSSDGQVVFQAQRQTRRFFRRARHPVVVFDRHGARLLKFDHAAVRSGAPDEVLVAFHAHLHKGLAPSVYALTPRRLFDCSHLNDPKALTAFLEKSFRFESHVAMIVQP